MFYKKHLGNGNGEVSQKNIDTKYNYCNVYKIDTFNAKLRIFFENRKQLILPTFNPSLSNITYCHILSGRTFSCLRNMYLQIRKK